MTETWKPIPGWEGIYEASNLGRIKSLARKVKSRGVRERILTPASQNSGYLFLALYRHNKEKRYLIHRLVAMAFIANPYNKKYVNHKNGVKTDNSVDNLEWCTFSENIKHSYDNGIRKIGDRHINRLISFNRTTKSIPVIQYDLRGNFVAEYSSYKEASNVTGINYSGISKTARGKAKTCGGYIWTVK